MSEMTANSSYDHSRMNRATRYKRKYNEQTTLLSDDSLNIIKFTCNAFDLLSSKRESRYLQGILQIWDKQSCGQCHRIL